MGDWSGKSEEDAASGKQRECGAILWEQYRMSGEALVSKLAVVAKYLVLPGAMAAAVIYSPPNIFIPKLKSSSSSSS